VCSSDLPLPTITLGANWYLRGNALKLSADIQWFLADSATNDLVGDATGIGFLDTADDGEIVVRMQVQFLF